MQKTLSDLYNELPNLSIENQLIQYSSILDILVKLARLDNLKGFVDEIVRSTRKLHSEFSVDTLKEIFSAFIVSGYDVYLIINSSKTNPKEISQSAFEFDSFELSIVRLYKKVSLRFHVLFDVVWYPIA